MNLLNLRQRKYQLLKISFKLFFSTSKDLMKIFLAFIKSSEAQFFFNN